jgi:hypothetical protein
VRHADGVYTGSIESLLLGVEACCGGCLECLQIAVAERCPLHPLQQPNDADIQFNLFARTHTSRVHVCTKVQGVYQSAVVYCRIKDTTTPNTGPNNCSPSTHLIASFWYPFSVVAKCKVEGSRAGGKRRCNRGAGGERRATSCRGSP